MPTVPHYLGHVVGIELYRTDVLVKREGTAPPQTEKTRGVITEFSKKSRQRLAFVASNSPVTFVTMITLTYPREYPHDGKHVKRHLNRFLTWYRKDTGGAHVLWFLEFQRRGAPHVHLLTDFPLPARLEDRKAIRFRVATTWYRICDSGDTRHLSAGTRVERIRKPDGARHYAVKYAMKMEQKEVPKDYQNVGRFWGCSRAVVPEPEREVRCTEDDLRAVLEGWRYLPSEERALYRVLYNTADTLREYLAALEEPAI